MEVIAWLIEVYKKFPLGLFIEPNSKLHSNNNKKTTRCQIVRTFLLLAHICSLVKNRSLLHNNLMQDYKIQCSSKLNFKHIFIYFFKVFIYFSKDFGHLVFVLVRICVGSVAKNKDWYT